MTEDVKTQFAPEVGDRMLIQPEGLGEKLGTYFIGMEPGRYVVTSLAPLVRDIGQLSRHLERGRRARLFYTGSGVVRGFLVQMLGFTTAPFRHLYLTYPEKHEAFNLRKHDRVECHLPAMLGDNGTRIRGMITNISVGGCALAAEPENAATAHLLEQDARTEVRFQCSTSRELTRVRCAIAQVRDEGGLCNVALRFEDMDEDAREALEYFVHFVAEYRI